ncbi:MAG: hypothetical protein KDI13_03040 [Alphaproteobacteria bacterium]|nr:hypothetical protein [Alphaproteobacteria bacterium]
MQGQEKTLYDVLADLWAARFFMAVGAVVALVAAFLFMGAAQPHYRAAMILGPANPMHGSGMMSGGAGLSVGEAENLGDFTRFVQIFRGPSVAAVLLKDEKVREGLLKDGAFFFSGGKESWSAAELARYLEGRVSVEPVAGTSLRRVFYLHPQKEFATYLIGRMTQVADGMIRAAIRGETQGRIDYLQEAIAKTVNPDHRRALTDLLMVEERMKMMVSTPQPYSAVVVEPPAFSARAVWPDSYLVYLLFVFGGLLLGFVGYGFSARKE